MAIRNLRYENDEILNKRSREIETIDEKIKELAQDMMDTMHKYDGVGLAAAKVRTNLAEYLEKGIVK